jgi:PAS domain S-box-containing protein
MEKVGIDKLQLENDFLRQQLQEAKDTIDAIRNGEIDALVVNGKDGHELYTLESADHTYRVFIEKMSEGAVTLNSNGVIVYSNSSFEAMVGKPAGGVVAEQFERFVINPDKEKFNALLKDGWKSDVKGEITLFHQQSLVPVQLSITTLDMYEGICLSIIITDLTDQKEILRQLKVKNDQLETMNIALELSNHDLQQFASVASHDLQEPLRKIQIFSHLLTEKFQHELSEVPKQYLQKIVGCANRMKVLIIDILNYSRLSANNNEFKNTDLNAMIAELLDDLELTIKEKNATIILKNLPKVEINRGQMRQVFQNLISNALKFSKSDASPVVEIFCDDNLTEFSTDEKLAGRYCHLHVKDNGIGFDQKYSRLIFNLFEKLHSKDDYGGTGIGLAITKKIIEKHHGHINVLSRIGVGTEFIISLPFTQKFTG